MTSVVPGFQPEIPDNNWTILLFAKKIQFVAATFDSIIRPIYKNSAVCVSLATPL